MAHLLEFEYIIMSPSVYVNDTVSSSQQISHCVTLRVCHQELVVPNAIKSHSSEQSAEKLVSNVLAQSTQDETPVT